MGRFKPFAACVFPAVFAFALSGIYAIVDGFFVGRSIGDTGLSAINIAYPVTALIQAAGTGTGMGGAVMYSVRLAEKRDSEAENFMKGVFFYLALTGILLTVILFPLTDPLLSLMGADGELMKPGREYLSVIVLGSVFQVFGTGVVPLIRNQGKSVQAMYCMIGGFVTNIFLDYLFVWVLRLGMAGAAWASVAGQAVTMAGGLLCMRGQKIPVPFLAFLRVTTAGFYATEQTRFSYMIVYGEPIFLALLLPVLPAWMGLKGVWWSQTGAQILTALMGWGLKLWSDRVHGYTADAV